LVQIIVDNTNKVIVLVPLQYLSAELKVAVHEQLQIALVLLCQFWIKMDLVERILKMIVLPQNQSFKVEVLDVEKEQHKIVTPQIHFSIIKSHPLFAEVGRQVIVALLNQFSFPIPKAVVSDNNRIVLVIRLS